MLKNYLKSSIRNLWKNKLHSLINITGLSVALAVSILILQFLRVETSFDQFHSNKENIYRLNVIEDWENGYYSYSPVSSFIIGETLLQNYSESIDRIQYYTQNVMVKNAAGESFSEPTAFGTPNFFEVFDFELNTLSSEPLKEINSVILTKEYATKFFGKQEILGEIIEIRVGNSYEPYKVTGIIDEVPYNSSLQFQMMIPMENARKMLPASNFEAWFFGLIETYLVLEPGLDKKAMEENFNKTVANAIGDRADEVEMTVVLQPLLDIHLENEIASGIAKVIDPSMLYILGGVALLILLIACINFTTMAISLAASRSHEVGIRKSIGAAKIQLFFQYMMEAGLLTLISVIVGIMIAESGLVFFNDLFNTQVVLTYDPIFLGIIFLLSLTVSFASGFYPALILASIRPIKILRKQLMMGGRNRLRKSLVTFQFAMSLMLIACTFIIQKQMRFIENKDLGFQKEMLLTADLNSPNVPGFRALFDTGFYKAEILKTELDKYPQFKTGASSQTIGKGMWMLLTFQDDQGVDHDFKFNVVDADYIPTLGMKLVEGQNFRKASPEFNQRSVIVNESFVKEFGMEKAVGEGIPGGKFQDLEIIGVLQDFHYESLHKEIKPMIMATDGRPIFKDIHNLVMDTDPAPDILIRMNADQLEENLALVQTIWSDVFPGEKFNYSFMNEILEEQYRSENSLSRMIATSTLIAILTAMLGLFAITALTLADKNKEIGIRKVLGATSFSITYLLTREFLALLLISFLISSPLSYFIMKQWLLKFEFQTPVGPALFLLVALIGLVFTLLTVSTQAFKASLRNPVHSIREE